VNDAVDRLIVERGAMDHGFSGGLLLSVVAHLGLVGVAIAAPYMRPKEPPIRVADGFAAPMPPGGGGTPKAEPAAPASAAPDPAPADPDPAPPPAVKPPDVIKPPSKTEPKKKGLPELNAKPKKSKKDEPDRPATSASNPPTKTQARSGAPGGTGTGPATPGLEFGPPGPGAPGGTDWLGDWYIAGVQRKIWSIWMQQIKTDFTQAVSVRFTIQQDGTLANVTVVQKSNSSMIDLAAQRAVYSAAPFGALPKTYGTSEITLQANFKPE
jgi:TonB family protein